MLANHTYANINGITRMIYNNVTATTVIYFWGSYQKHFQGEVRQSQMREFDLERIKIELKIGSEIKKFKILLM